MNICPVQLDGGARHIAGLFGAEPTNRSAEIGLGITHPTERCRFDQSIEDLGMACMALLRHWSPSGGRHQESPNAIDAPLNPSLTSQGQHGVFSDEIRSESIVHTFIDHLCPRAHIDHHSRSLQQVWEASSHKRPRGLVASR